MYILIRTYTKKLLKKYASVISIDEINKFLNWMNDVELADIICLAAALKGIKVNAGQALSLSVVLGIEIV